MRKTWLIPIIFVGAISLTHVFAATATESEPTAIRTHQSLNSQWHPVVVQSLSSIQGKTSAPLIAPYFIQEVEHQKTPYVSGLTKVSKNRYRVEFRSTLTPLTVNHPRINHPENTGLSRFIGNYSVTKFPDSEQALNALNIREVPTNSTSHSVDLGHGIRGTEYIYSGERAMVRWKQGSWNYEVGSHKSYIAVKESRHIVDFVRTHELPEEPGVYDEYVAGDGHKTKLTWSIGTTVIIAYNEHYETDAIKMAISMKTYPFGSAKFPRQ